MKKTPKKQNKETVLSVLKEVRDLLKEKTAPIVTNSADMGKSEISKITSPSGSITFPSLTAKEIMDECDNKVAGGSLLYKSGWYDNEDFFTKEKCRPRTVKIPTEILHAGKSWDEIDRIKGELELFNFAEIVYMLRESEEFRKLLSWEGNTVYYTWTNSRDSDGDLVFVGCFDSDGAGVSRWKPGLSDSGMGVCFSRSE